MVRWPLAGTAIGYGVQLGAAVTTRITNFATYAALASALLTRNAVLGACIMLVFGLVRALPAVVVGPLADSPQRSFAFAFRVGEWEQRVHKASGAILLLAALLLALSIGSRV
jgi:cytochrome c biogenesis protein CcdA